MIPDYVGELLDDLSVVQSKIQSIRVVIIINGVCEHYEATRDMTPPPPTFDDAGVG